MRNDIEKIQLDRVGGVWLGDMAAPVCNEGWPGNHSDPVTFTRTPELRGS